MSDQSRSVTFVIWERLRVKTVKKLVVFQLECERNETFKNGIIKRKEKLLCGQFSILLCIERFSKYDIFMKIFNI